MSRRKPIKPKVRGLQGLSESKSEPPAAPSAPPKAGTATLRTLKDGKLVTPPELTPEQVRDVHELTQDTGPYARLVSFLPEAQDSAHLVLGSSPEYVEQFLAEMAPRNTAERMLAVQMLFQHVRIGRLVSQAPKSDPRTFSAINAAIDSAMNTFRRQVATWDALRSPRPVQFIKEQQVNVGRQQVISQGAVPSLKMEKPANEQGLPDANRTPLLPQRLGPEVPPLICPQEQTVEEVHRPNVAKRQSKVVAKRPQARRTIGNNPRHPKESDERDQVPACD